LDLREKELIGLSTREEKTGKGDQRSKQVGSGSLFTAEGSEGGKERGGRVHLTKRGGSKMWVATWAEDGPA